MTALVVTEYLNPSISKRGHAVSKIGPTKSPTGVRTLHIDTVAVLELLEWKKRNPFKNSAYIFPNCKGDFLSYSALRSRFNRFIKHIGLEKKGYIMYRFRHTFCTNLLKMGVSIPEVQKLMGDSSPTMILKIYNHLKDSDMYHCSE